MAPLKDPLDDRHVKSMPTPMHQPLTHDELFPGPNEIDWKLLRDHLHREGRVLAEHALEIIRRMGELLRSEPNLIKLKDPITVVGDIHGQYYDFIKLLDVGGDPPNTQYLFLGDYVDRGSYSIEVLLLIYSMKLTFPKRIWMLRGNHESRQMTQFFNFRDECEHKYDKTVFIAIMESFDCLPLGALVNGKFLGLHGGISPELRSTNQINSVNRFEEPPRQGIFCDILWADPVDEDSSGKKTLEPFIQNEVRGCSYFFSYEGAKQFLDRNGLLSVIRAHEAQLEGYKMHRANERSGFPTVITIFSAPNYCDAYNNKAAVLQFENNTLNILQFNYTPHPYHLPNFMDVFQWSVPFVAEKVTEMLCVILQPSLDEDDDDAEVEDLPPVVESTYRNSLSHDQNVAVEMAARIQQKFENQEADGGKKKSQKEKKERMRRKIRTVAKMQRMFKTMRQQNESVLKIGGVGHKLSPGILLEQQQNTSDMFANIRQADMANERMPTKPNRDAQTNVEAKPNWDAKPNGVAKPNWDAKPTRDAKPNGDAKPQPSE
jgi:serine/threonine-protein phosphatase 2B catalytic subunit